jgi:two-component system chemotaxis sensor kinase CheA
MSQAYARYLGLFVSEASEHLARIAAELVRLEIAAREGGPTGDAVGDLFRHVHSVKGMAASLEIDGVAAIAHRAEDLVGAFRGARAPDAASIDVLLATVDALTAMVESVRAGANPRADPALLDRLAAAIAGGSPADPARPAAPRRLEVEVDLAADCVVPAVRAFLVVKRLERLGAVLRSSPPLEELRGGDLPVRTLSVVLETAAGAGEVERTLAQIAELERVAVREAPPTADARRPAPASAAGPRGAPAHEGRTVRVRAELLDSFLDAVGELILATARLREIGRRLPDEHRPELEDGVERLQATVKDLHDRVMAVRMMPLASITERLPRAARDLARRAGKQVDVEVRGAEIELDRALLDELANPLLHVLRNAVDHGVEPPEDRERAGKAPAGRVTVTARRVRDRVLVEIADDGRGMDPRRLRDAAVAAGALSRAAADGLADRDALMLACLPGISTARELTEVSGRGVGMDAVKRTVDALGGALEVESTAGAGTRWSFRLPLTVAVQPILLVAAGGEVVALPVAKVHGAVQLPAGALERGPGGVGLEASGERVAVHDLATLLGFGAVEPKAVSSVVVADADGGRVGLAVDALLGQQDAVLKPLLRPFDRVAGLSAVTVLASGRPVFVLDVARLVTA